MTHFISNNSLSSQKNCNSFLLFEGFMFKHLLEIYTWGSRWFLKCNISLTEVTNIFSSQKRVQAIQLERMSLNPTRLLTDRDSCLRFIISKILMIIIESLLHLWHKMWSILKTDKVTMKNSMEVALKNK